MLSMNVFRAIIDSIQDGIIAVDLAERIIIINRSAEKLLKIDRDAALGKPVGDVVPNTGLPVVLRTGQPELNQFQQLEDTTIVTNRMPVFDSSGKITAAVAVFRDITEVKHLAEEVTNLRELHSLLEAIINSTQDAISVVDSEGRGILINKAYTRIVGLTKEDVIGKPATVDIAEGESVHYQVLRTGEPIKGVPMRVGPNRKEVIVHAAPIIVGGKLKGSVAVIHDVSEIKRLTEELDYVKRRMRHLEAKYSFDDIIGKSRAIREAMEAAKNAAGTNVTVLLRGESGTGKELFAHAIHNSSERRHNQFIRVNCAALTDSLLGSELFGYADGAFTGARRGGRKGLFEEANGGTIFLDEIGEIGLNHQAMLLRVLNEKEIIRVGESKPIPVNVRVIAATNINLEKAVEEGRFRKDLYYRLNVVPIYIPPLRERKEDIPLLTEHFIKKCNQEYGRAVEAVDEEALEVLMDYDWPGNIRELENVISRAIINMKFGETVIGKKHLPRLYFNQNEDKSESIAITEHSMPLKEILKDVEKKTIKSVLEKVDGNRNEAARILGISVRNLFYKLKKFNL
ncbi:sigma-54 interaction domain-containing protein [Thermosediminibacter oceani]|uniref:PAS modulated sigma54 specific transcriptional regulator, Fis family n=1 Tax=Thermosediminibacter oceani (strain ATCC BAA-1034 / DSM 16646 / JW/IW-1228P) TaxID=555079 RepID=D9S2G4_THEOJ|nr:sigma-54-dependent Fis family transcriptional regulator [Thermosediminibacter oceani]ADL07591.1 PAS modulated sigma54 specific transcriptional regulator, Fis family [Thermosediminibacter oceani DSM 16646]